MKDFAEEVINAAHRLYYQEIPPLGTLLKGAVGMYMSDWWRTVPQWTDPGTVSGEIDWK